MTIHEILPPSSASIKTGVVLLHGYGADGQDLLSLGETWQQDFPHTVFLSPDAPFPFENAPFGRQWFSLRDYSMEFMIQGILQARPLVAHLMAKIMQTYELETNNLALVGFSQGAMVALDYALHSGDDIPAVIAYSGLYLPVPSPLLSSPQVLMVHGQEDQVLPLEFYKKSKLKLESLGIHVKGHIRENLGHGIDDRGVQEGRRFLQQNLINPKNQKESHHGTA